MANSMKVEMGREKVSFSVPFLLFDPAACLALRREVEWGL
jgi:hypothetical protein